MADYIHINPEDADFLKQQSLLDLNHLLSRTDGKVVSERKKFDCRKISVENSNIPKETKEFYLRQEYHIYWRDFFADIFALRKPTSKAIKILEAEKLFSSNGIDAVRTSAAIERKYFFKPSKAAALQRPVNGEDVYCKLLEFGLAISRKDNPLARTQLLRELGIFLAKIQFAKINWPDLLPKHVYVQKTSDNIQSKSNWQFTLIDIERARAGLNPKTRTKQLKRFIHSMRGLLSVTDLLRIAMGYVGFESAAPRDVRRKLWQKFFPNGMDWLSDIRKENQYLKTYPTDRPLPEKELYERIGSMVYNIRFKDALGEQGLLEPDKILTFQKGNELYKPGLGRRFRMRFEAIIDGRPNWLYLKRVRHPRLKDQWDRILSGTIKHAGTNHERMMIKALGESRIPAPVIVAYAEKMVGPYEKSSALITQGIVGQSLEIYLPKHFSRGDGQEKLNTRRAWIRQLAELISRFHREGFCHRDLYLSHIFIGFKENGDPIFHMIDLGRCFKMGLRRQRWILKDLAALQFSTPEFMISQTDRLRFYRTYAGKDKLDERDKQLLKKIQRKCDRIERHTLKHHKVTKERAVS